MAEVPVGEGSVPLHFLAGMLGGAAHASLVCPIMAKPASAALGNLSTSGSHALTSFPTWHDRMVATRKLYPKLLARDMIAYGGFFGTYNMVCLLLEPPRGNEEALFSPRAIGRTMVAGGVAGLTYHLVAHPFDATTVDAMSVAGWARAFRRSLPAIGMGSVTFAVYDTLVKFFEPSSR